jgi:HEPN domain-containing protein
VIDLFRKKIKLFRKRTTIDVSVPIDILNCAEKIEKHYLSSRYPDALPGIAPMDAYDEKKALHIKKDCTKIIEFIDQTHSNIIASINMENEDKNAT